MVLKRLIGLVFAGALVFSAAALAIVGNALIRSPLESGIGLALVLAGVPIFLIWQRRAKQKAVIPLLDKEGSGVVDRGVITPTASSCEGGESSGNKRERGD